MVKKQSILQAFQNKNLKYWAQFIALISTKEWQRKYPTSKAHSHLANVQRMTVGSHHDRPTSHNNIDLRSLSKHFTAMLNEAKASDNELDWSEDNLGWFFQAVEEKDTLSLIYMQASSSDAQELISLQEVADATDSSASSWRAKCNSGMVEGAKKVGKTWFVPKFVINCKSYNLAVGRPPKE